MIQDTNRIQQAVASLKPERVHIYSQGWWGSPSHISIGYRSDDPSIVRRQVESCQAVVAPAILNTVPAWYSPSNQPNNTYCQLLRDESERRGTQFAIMCPPTPSWIKEDAKALLAYLRDNFFKSPAYARYNGKLMFWSFNASSSLLNLIKAEPDILVLTENSGVYSYSWPNGFPPKDSPQKYMQRYLSEKGQVMIPCLWRLFDDHKVSSPSQSAWGGPARYMAAGSTGWDLQDSLVSEIEKTGKQFTELGLLLDDYEEGTREEPWILQEYGQMLVDEGIRLQAQNQRKDQV